MSSPVYVEDIEARWRPLTEQEHTNAEALLEDAWALILKRRRTLEADLAAETVSQADVTRVMCAMVLRVLRNPEGLLEEQLDDYRYRRDAAISAGLLYVSDDELNDITPAVTDRHRNSVRLVVYGDA